MLNTRKVKFELFALLYLSFKDQPSLGKTKGLPTVENVEKEVEENGRNLMTV